MAAWSDTAVSTTAQQRYLSDRLQQRQLMLFLGSETPTGFSWLTSVDELVQLPWQAIYTTTRNQQVENKCRQYRVPHEVIDQPQQQSGVGNGRLPIYKLYGSPNQTVLSGQRLDLPHWQEFSRQIRAGLESGLTLLAICASAAELAMVHESCYSDVVHNKMWISDADISEEGQDEYRTLGWRVLPDTPDALSRILRDL
ncbi:MAG: hypothetical protein KC421_25565, partial [Anaerolineales bacterium]|nr:hypothetical protein [Anaerolineales bacterium]